MTHGPRRAVVIAPAAPGVGGQGRAAADIAEGLTAGGLPVSYMSVPQGGVVGRMSRRRPLRRWPQVGRAAGHRAGQHLVLGDWSLAYAMPGYLPRHSAGVRVLHQATRHPRVVLDRVAHAAARAGGGRGFMTVREAKALERELTDADLIRAECAAVAEELVAHGVPQTRVIIELPGVDTARFRPVAKPARLNVAFVGTLSLWKGIDVLAALAPRLPHDGRLHVVGGPVCPWSRRLAASIPMVREHDVAACLAPAHALVLPSAADGFGYVVLEAMASGAVPFVTPDVGAAEVVRRIDPRLVVDGDEFAERVPFLLDDLPLALLARRARRVALELDRRTRSESTGRAILRAAGMLPTEQQRDVR